MFNTKLDRVILKVAKSEKHLDNFFNILLKSEIYFMQNPVSEERNPFQENLMLTEVSDSEVECAFHIVRDEGVMSIPIFTSVPEINTYTMGKQFNYVKINFQKLLKLLPSQFDGRFIVNPSNQCMRFTLYEILKYLEK